MKKKILTVKLIAWGCFYFLFVLGTVIAGSDFTAGRIRTESGFKGGLIVQAGMRDAALAVELGASSNVVFHGLVRDAGTLEKVRNQIISAGLYGRVSAIQWNGRLLPYADNMVNLLLVEEDAGLEPSEIDRVLAPLGSAIIQKAGRTETRCKPWPANVDVWTHSRHDATGNAVSCDQLTGPPRFTQWEALPRWNHGTKTSAMVTTGGRIFYILDDSDFSTARPTWSLIARDASNGIRLWRHQLDGWEGSRGGKKVGPAQVNRRLAAVGDRVYAPLGEDAAVSVMEAATGKILRTLDKTAKVEEFLVSNGVLVALVNESSDIRFWTRLNRTMRIVAVDPESGKTLWEHIAKKILPMTLTADTEQVLWHNGTSIVSFVLRSGKARWTSPPTGQKVVLRDKANCDSPGAEKSTIVLAPQFAPTMVIYSNVVAFAGGRQLNVVSAESGKELWRAPYAPSNYSTPVDLFGFGGSLWGPDAGMNLWRPMDDDLGFRAYDPVTGEMRKDVSGKYNYRFQHHRCHQMKVVGNTVLGARAGIEFLNTETGHLDAHHWTRGSCYFGVLPANGLLYIPPHNCACYVRAKLSGLMSMSAVDPIRPDPIPDNERLLQGGAFGRIGDALASGTKDWPTYRHDAKRSGKTSASIGRELLQGWETELTAPLTAPVVANGRVFLASTEAHRLYSIEAATGKVAWQCTLDGRIDSPPTLHKGVVLCGCHDGSVYALRASDGELVWRFRAAPEERMIVSRGQLESVWPVYGSVLVVNDNAYFAAGKSSYVDGGIRVYGLNVLTGEKIFESLLNTLGDDGSEVLDEESVDGYLNDILSCNGVRIFMRHQAMDLSCKPKPGKVTHMHGPDGYLSSDTTSRLLWTYAPVYTSPHQGAFYDLRLSRSLFPSGRILVEGDDTIYGFGQNHFTKMQVEPGGQFALFAAPKKSDVPLDMTVREYRKLALSGKQSVKFKWWQSVPINAWALIRTKDTLFAAGARGTATVSPEALAGKEEGKLLAVSPDDGKVLSEMFLSAMPVWDGMAVAGDSLYISLANGRLACLWSADTGRPGKPLSASAMQKLLPPVRIDQDDGLLGHWRLDEGMSTLARDCSSRGHDAEVNGDWIAEGSRKVIATEGRSGSLVIPDAPHLHFGNGDFALSLWFKTDEFDVRILGKEAFPANWWVINLSPDGQLELVLGEGREPGRNMRAKTKATIEKGVWNHLAVVADRKAREVFWYINGKLDSCHSIPATMTGDLNAAGKDIAIPSKHKPFNGAVGDFRIYGRTLSAERARKIYEEGAALRNE